MHFYAFVCTCSSTGFSESANELGGKNFELVSISISHCRYTDYDKVTASIDVLSSYYLYILLLIRIMVHKCNITLNAHVT